MAQNPKRGNTVVIVVLTVLIVLMIAATALLIYLSIDLVNKQGNHAAAAAHNIAVTCATDFCFAAVTALCDSHRFFKRL